MLKFVKNNLQICLFKKFVLSLHKKIKGNN
ncbi:hypothetical protein [Riemerella phage vB_RanS_GDF21]